MLNCGHTAAAHAVAAQAARIKDCYDIADARALAKQSCRTRLSIIIIIIIIIIILGLTSVFRASMGSTGPP